MRMRDRRLVGILRRRRRRLVDRKRSGRSGRSLVQVLGWGLPELSQVREAQRVED